MRARAPGKLVLSGAYSVLWGAPALVTAVDRYAIADTEHAARHVAREVEAAVELGLVPRPCLVDASALRAPMDDGSTRKLGLGSSAAIVVATLAAFRGAPLDAIARTRLFEDALAAHRRAQGGGSGLDVAASTFGGTLRFELGDDVPAPTAHELPPGLVIGVLAAREPAITAELVARVRALAAAEPDSFASLLEPARRGAVVAATATRAEDFVAALERQIAALATLGASAGVAIVTDAMGALGARARADGAHFGPSGAGGGDVCIHVGLKPPSQDFVSAARASGFEPVDLRVGARGVELLEDP